MRFGQRFSCRQTDANSGERARASGSGVQADLFLRHTRLLKQSRDPIEQNAGKPLGLVERDLANHLRIGSQRQTPKLMRGVNGQRDQLLTP